MHNFFIYHSVSVNIFSNKIFKNFSLLTIANLLVQVLAVIASIRLARQLQPDGYGLFNLVYVQASIFSIIAAYGLRNVIVRHIARNKDHILKIFQVSNQIRGVSTFIAILVAIGYNLLQQEEMLSASFMIALCILIIFLTFWDTIESVSFGSERMDGTGFISLAFAAAWVIVVYLIPTQYFSVITLLYAFVINHVLKALVYYWWIKRKILSNQKNDVKISFSDHKELLKQSNFYFILAVFTGIQNQIPVLFLQLNSTIDQIGIFNLGNRILSPLQMVLNILLTALFPMFSRLAIDNPQLFAKRIKSLLNIIVLLGVLGCVCFSLFSDDIVRLFYGESYLNSARVILIQCWYTVLFAIFSTIGTVLSSMDKHKLLALLATINGTLTTPIFFFGAKYGAIGLAWAFVIAAFVSMTYHWVIFLNNLHIRISIVYSLFLFSVIAVLLFFFSFFKITWSFQVRMAIGMVSSFMVVLYLYKVEYKKLVFSSIH